MQLFCDTTLLIFTFLFWEFFPPAIAGGLSLEFVWQQVSSSHRDSSQYSGRYQQCCSLDGFHASSYFQVVQFLRPSFGDCTKSTNQNWYHRYCATVFQFLSKTHVLISFHFLSIFLCLLSLVLVVWSGLSDPFVSQNPRGVCEFHSAGQTLHCAHTINS